MRNIILVICFLFSFSVFSQDTEGETKKEKIPTSIFAVSLLNFQGGNEITNLHLSGHKFMIIDFFNNDFSISNADRIKVDLRNFGRHISYEDLSDNYSKARLNSFDVSRNNNHFIWSMWDTRIQKRRQKDLQKSNY